jgi:hypothetical protein
VIYFRKWVGAVVLTFMWGEGQFQESLSRSIFFQAGQDMQQKMLVLGVECMECHHSGAGKLKQV